MNKIIVKGYFAIYQADAPGISEKYYLLVHSPSGVRKEFVLTMKGDRVSDFWTDFAKRHNKKDERWVDRITSELPLGLDSAFDLIIESYSDEYLSLKLDKSPERGIVLGPLANNKALIVRYLTSLLDDKEYHIRALSQTSFEIEYERPFFGNKVHATLEIHNHDGGFYYGKLRIIKPRMALTRFINHQGLVTHKSLSKGSPERDSIVILKKVREVISELKVDPHFVEDYYQKDELDATPDGIQSGKPSLSPKYKVVLGAQTQSCAQVGVSFNLYNTFLSNSPEQYIWLQIESEHGATGVYAAVVTKEDIGDLTLTPTQMIMLSVKEGDLIHVRKLSNIPIVKTLGIRMRGGTNSWTERNVDKKVLDLITPDYSNLVGIFESLHSQRGVNIFPVLNKGHSYVYRSNKGLSLVFDVMDINNGGSYGSLASFERVPVDSHLSLTYTREYIEDLLKDHKQFIKFRRDPLEIASQSDTEEDD